MGEAMYVGNMVLPAAILTLSFCLHTQTTHRCRDLVRNVASHGTVSSLARVRHKDFKLRSAKLSADLHEARHRC